MPQLPPPASTLRPRPLYGRPAAALALVALAALTGCATAFAPAAPELDARLGSTTRQALAQQVLRPQAGAGPTDAAAPFDGVAAVHTLARHREGFKTPPSSFSVLGIGSGSGSGQP